MLLHNSAHMSLNHRQLCSKAQMVGWTLANIRGQRGLNGQSSQVRERQTDWLTKSLPWMQEILAWWIVFFFLMMSNIYFLPSLYILIFDLEVITNQCSICNSYTWPLKNILQYWTIHLTLRFAYICVYSKYAQNMRQFFTLTTRCWILVAK